MVQDMENLILQAFETIEPLYPIIRAGEYDLIGPDGEIILPRYWTATIVPDMIVNMVLWNSSLLTNSKNIQLNAEIISTPRGKFKLQHTATLEDLFQSNHRPSTQTRLEYAEKLGLKDSVVIDVCSKIRIMTLQSANSIDLVSKQACKREVLTAFTKAGRKGNFS